jgi:NAD(P)-dependent dehydrogenase (short-subunit alcohol dehydrogenase family)
MQVSAGQTAVITGGGSGIGRGIALSLARCGLNVVVADYDESAAIATASEISALGVEALAVATDVACRDDVVELAEEAYRRFGAVEILVNNAGVALRPYRATWDTSYPDYQWIIGVNLWGVIHGHDVFVPRMLDSPGEKHIVNTSSFATFYAVGGLAAYTASKHAVDGFSLCAAGELRGRGIGLTILYPGNVSTSIGSAERLRPMTDQSENRTVTPYSQYLESGDGADDAKFAGRGPRDPSRPGYEAIDPGAVGPMVVEAIRHNKLYCTTHPAPLADLQRRLDAIAAGYS